MDKLKLSLMVLVVVLLVLSVGVIYYVNKYKKSKENFQASLVKLSQTDKCNFVPWGSSRQGCINRCMSDDKKYWGGDSCDLPNCRKLCDDCDDPNRCKWQKTETRTAPVIQNKFLLNQNYVAQMRRLCARENINNDNNKNTSFIIKWFKTYVPDDGVKIQFT